MKPDVVRRLALTFLFGGCFGAASQLLVTLWAAVLGPESPWVMTAMLATLGAVGAALYVAGIYQKLEEIGSMGAVMPFSGLVSAVASAYLEGFSRGGVAGGAAEGAKFFLYVLGVGAFLSAAIGLLIAWA